MLMCCVQCTLTRACVGVVNPGVVGMAATDIYLAIDRYNGRPDDAHVSTFFDGISDRAAMAGAVVVGCNSTLSNAVCTSCCRDVQPHCQLFLLSLFGISACLFLLHESTLSIFTNACPVPVAAALCIAVYRVSRVLFCVGFCTCALHQCRPAHHCRCAALCDAVGHPSHPRVALF